MRWRSLAWLCVSVFFFLAAAYFWQLGNEWAAQKKSSRGTTATNQPNASAKGAALSSTAKPGRSMAAPIHLLTTPGNLNAAIAAQDKNQKPAKPDERFKYRLSNTSVKVGELAKRETGILLQNALLDSAQPIALNIPDSLRSKGDPGTYIVQAKGPIDDNFRAVLKNAGATIVSYVPNNAFLVRASASAAQEIAASAQTVLSYEPYYKLSPSLLKSAVEEQSLPEKAALNVLLFADAHDGTVSELKKQGAEILGEERSPFGPLLKVKPTADGLAAIAQSTGVQAVELLHQRTRANDLSRVAVGVASDTQVASNYLALDGTGILVNVNDTGVDATHPDLTKRVFGDFSSSLLDTDGHGTHVAGIIAGDGTQSTTVSNASGSILPPVTGQFRGMAPKADLFAMSIDATFGIAGAESSFGPFGSDSYLQETAAKTNAIISNNSWHYFADSDYDLAAASYDAAVRDALPGVTGSQPLLYVFAAGNNGQGGDDGGGGNPDSIQSPATAKNVITVGSVEQARNITNQTIVLIPGQTDTNGNPRYQTNEPWFGLTDSSNEIASFSSRGNVGIGTEGDSGRFKPDLVAPGTFVVSTRSQQWDTNAYFNPTNHHFNFETDLSVNTNSIAKFGIFVPFNTVGLNIRAFGPVDLPIYVRKAGFPTATTYDFLGTNVVSSPRDLPLTPLDTDWFYGIGNPTSVTISFSVETELITTNDLGSYLDVLRTNLDGGLGQYYRYESGTSMSAADVSGVLALMHQYYQQFAAPKLTNSPALMKALLINGATILSAQYDYAVRGTINEQGWGMVNLPNSLLTNYNSSHSSAFLQDQSPTNALATGQSQSYTIALDPQTANNSLRVTLVWTDPPGNPVAGIKLVNDLDLIVSNSVPNGDVYHGNDMTSGLTFTLPSDTNAPPNEDFVNNVENVFLLPNTGTNFVVTVRAKRVNVNSVTAHTNDIVQDYALVVSCGATAPGDGITVTPLTPAAATPTAFTGVTNSFVNDPNDFGGFLMQQHAGAHTPLLGNNTIAYSAVNGQITLGMTNQWHFYTISNGTSFTNAAFLTFLPPTLSVPRIGVLETDPNNASRLEADIDLYVSVDPSLTNLNPAAISAAFKSVGRGGTETIVISNAVPGAIYYVGVKSEDLEAAEFSFLGVFSLDPFGSSDANGNLTLRGFPVNSVIPDGGPDAPAGTQIFAIAPSPIQIKRVIVTNVISHEQVTDLIGTFSHGAAGAVVLNNHSGEGTVTNLALVYNDSAQRDIPNAHHTDGPGNLRSFEGREGAGQWRLSMVDDSPGAVGTNMSLTVWLEKQQDLLGGIDLTLLPGECGSAYIYVPVEATNLTIIGTITAGGGPGVTMEVCPLGASGSDCVTTTLGGIGFTNQITIDKSSNPPLNLGLYVVTVCNNSTGPVTVHLLARLFLDANGVVAVKYASGSPLTILDDAVTTSSILVTNDTKIATAEVGLRIDHPRVSDLMVHLITPNGTRILLDQNRGGTTTNGMGSSSFSTNIIPVSASGGALPETNTFDTGTSSGTITISYDFLQVADDMKVYYDTNLIWDSGFVSYTGVTNITYGPTNGDTSTFITIIMNQDGNTNNTAWSYTVTSTLANYSYLTFTEDTNKTITPIKFAVPPFATVSNSSTTQSLGGFEAVSGDFGTGAGVDGWTVLGGQVSVVTDPTVANSGTHSLALANGSISRVVPTVKGSQYQVTYHYRGPSIVGWWRGEANANDQINGINGTLAPPVTYAQGQVGGAFVFGGTGGGVNLPDASQLAFTNSFSLEGWFFVTNGPVRPGQIFFRGDQRSGFDPYFLDIEPASGYPNGMLQFGIEDATSTAAFTRSQVPTNAWTHVAATFDGNSGAMKLFTNGILASQTSTGLRPLGPLNPASSPGVGLGNHSSQPGGFNYPFRGRLDELSMYQRAITPSEIKAIYQTGSTGKFDAALSAPLNLAEMRVSIQGATNLVNGQNTNWSTGTFVFTATNASTVIKLDGLEPGMIIDDISIAGGASVSPYYVLPEDPYGLSGLTGKSAQGDWKIEIWDTRVGAFATNAPPTLISWGLSFVFETPVPKPIPAIDDITNTNTVNPGSIIYFTVTVPPWASFATNILTFTSPSQPLNVLFNQNILPTGTNFGDIALLSQVPSGSATLVTNGAPPLIPGSTYFIGIQNTGAVATTFGFKVDFDVTPLSLGVPVPATAFSNTFQRYFSYEVTSNESAVSFQLTNLNGNVDLVVSKTPFPDLTTFSYGSFNPGIYNESIVIFTNSDPVQLTPGRWYLGVFNRNPTTNVDYTVVVTDMTDPIPPIITLHNMIPYGNTNTAVAGLTNDYYKFRVSTNSLRAQFEIDSPSADMALAVRKGIPLPTATSNDIFSQNPGTSDEVIVLVTNGIPVPLTPGDWFLTAVNMSGVPASYTIKASEWSYNSALVITNEYVTSNSFCITWTSLAGLVYHVEGRVDLTNPGWTTVSPDITAVGPTTTWCLPLPSPYHFFRVATGPGVVTSFAPLSITNITRTASSVTLQWQTPSNSTVAVEWSPVLLSGAWSTFSNLFFSTNGPTSTFVDDGTQSGGLGGTRFYRLLQLP